MIKSSLASLVIIIGIIILVVSAFYYLNTEQTLGFQNMKYLSLDYIAYQNGIYTSFVEIPYLIRYEINNYIYSISIFSNNIYTNFDNYIYSRNSIYYNTYYDECLPNETYAYASSSYNPSGYNYLNISYGLCLPLLTVINIQDNILGNEIGYSILNDIESTVNNQNYIKLSGGDYSSNQITLDINFEYSYQSIFQHIFNMQLNYSFIPYYIYYNYISGYIYNRSLYRITYFIQNPQIVGNYNDYKSIDNGNLLLYSINYNSNSLYLADLYYNTSNIEDLQLPVLCQTVGQNDNGNCVVNMYYRNLCIDSGQTETLAEYLGGNTVSSSQIFSGYFYNIVSTNYIYNNNSILPDLISCTDYLNDVCNYNLFNNYTVFTDGNFPILVNTTLNAVYDNISCSVSSVSVDIPFGSVKECLKYISGVEGAVSHLNSLGIKCSVDSGCGTGTVRVSCSNYPYITYNGEFSVNYENLFTLFNINETICSNNNIINFCNGLS
ncbi:hypothetical protein MJ1_0050 [Nanobdella aerobiophila]|uniref:Transmembrane protein n=1 Tax=Nanobdella aerobiophila TaxID=2586965 RepID=A0A915SZG3_9ARCH|nr:hypothetical protein [Nanobdella aerobiophila]BBL45229.1 hypothetical protein MJ1_0050 [Nanobdella aerobiophila]